LSVFVEKVRGDDDGVERLSLGDVVKERLTFRAVGEARHELESAQAQIGPPGGLLSNEAKLDAREGGQLSGKAKRGHGY
jgi:hypothetical protein